MHLEVKQLIVIRILGIYNWIIYKLCKILSSAFDLVLLCDLNRELSNYDVKYMNMHNGNCFILTIGWINISWKLWSHRVAVEKWEWGVDSKSAEQRTSLHRQYDTSSEAEPQRKQQSLDRHTCTRSPTQANYYALVNGVFYTHTYTTSSCSTTTCAASVCPQLKCFTNSTLSLSVSDLSSPPSVRHSSFICAV